MVQNIAGNMLVKQETAKRQLPLQAHQLKAQVQIVVEDAGQQQNREADVPEPQEVTDIVGNTEDEKKDFRNNRVG